MAARSSTTSILPGTTRVSGPIRSDSSRLRAKGSPSRQSTTRARSMEVRGSACSNLNESSSRDRRAKTRRRPPARLRAAAVGLIVSWPPILPDRRGCPQRRANRCASSGAWDLAAAPSTGAMISVPRFSVQSLDDAHVAFAGIAERLKCHLIRGAVMCGDSLFDAVELRDRGALVNSLLIGHRGHPAYEEAAAAGQNDGTGEFPVCLECRGIGDGAIEGDPVGLRHDVFS